MCHLCSLGEWPFVFWGAKMFQKITASIYLTINVSSLHKTHVTRVTLVYYDMETFSLPTQSIGWGCVCHKIESSAMLRIPHSFDTHIRRSYCHLFLCVHSSFFMLELFCTLDHLHYLVFNKLYVWYVLCFSSLWYLNIPLYRTSGLIRIHVMPSFLQGSARRFSRAIRMFLQPAILAPN